MQLLKRISGTATMRASGSKVMDFLQAETTLGIDAGAVDIVQERAPILNVGLAVTELKDLDSYATSC